MTSFTDVMGVSGMLPVCHRCVTGVSPVCHRCVTTVSPVCHRCVTGVTDSAALCHVTRIFIHCLLPFCIIYIHTKQQNTIKDAVIERSTLSLAESAGCGQSQGHCEGRTAAPSAGGEWNHAASEVGVGSEPITGQRVESV